MKRTKYEVYDGDLSGFRPYELCSSSTSTVVDNTTGIKYIVKRWQETGIVPSQIVRHPLPASDKLYPFEKVKDLSDIPTKHEYRSRRIQRDAQRELNAMRDVKVSESNVHASTPSPTKHSNTVEPDVSANNIVQ